MKSLFFNPWITSLCRFYAARDMCHPLTDRLPKQQWSWSWHSTITIVSVSSLLVIDWLSLKSHMFFFVSFQFSMCVEQGNPKSRTFIFLYFRILISLTHTHTHLPLAIQKSLGFLIFIYSSHSLQWHQRNNLLPKPHLLLLLKAKERRKFTSQELLPFPTPIVKWKRGWLSSQKGKLSHQDTCQKLVLMPWVVLKLSKPSFSIWVCLTLLLLLS